jgi:hypothetical protein
MRYFGGCHCGALKVRYRTALEPPSWLVRACQCSFCLRHGALSTSDPNGQLEFQAEDLSLMQRYQFETRTADFLLCRACGVYVGAQMLGEAGRYGIVNLRCLQGLPPAWSAAQPIDYSSEDREARRSRRQARWTPVAGDSL